MHWDESIAPSGTWCRHSFATNLCNAGVELDYICESIFSCFPFRREKADMVIRSWLSSHKNEYDAFLRHIDNISNGDLAVRDVPKG